MTRFTLLTQIRMDLRVVLYPLLAVQAIAGGQSEARPPSIVNMAELARRAQPAPSTPPAPRYIPAPVSRPPTLAHDQEPLALLTPGTFNRLMDFRPMSAGFNPLLRTNFSALPDNIAIAAIPPDTQGTVGLEHLMVTLNSEVAVLSRQGQMISKVALTDFWKSMGHAFVFDTKVIFDHLANRWVFVTLADPNSTNSVMLVAASRTADPTQDWYRYEIKANPPPDPRNTNPPPLVWLDYPNIGYNQQWFVATVNTPLLNSTNSGASDPDFDQPEGDGPSTEGPGSSTPAAGAATIFAFDKAALYAGKSPAYSRFDDPQFTVVPAVCYDNNPTNFYLVTEAATTQAGIVQQLRISRLEGLVGQERYVTNSATTPAAPAWSFSPGQTNFAAQLGTGVKLYCNDSRLQYCRLRQGSLWCIQHVFLPAGPQTNVTRCAVQWWQISTNGAVVQRGLIDDPTGKTNYIFPSLAVNKLGDVLIGYTRVASDQYASAVYTCRTASDPLNLLRGETVFKAGLAPYRKSNARDGQTRWGDFSCAVVDPLNDVDMWTIQEYAEAPQNNTDRWGTWWAYVGFQAQSPPVFIQGPLTQPVWSFGTNVTLLTTLQGTTPFIYQWLFNGTNLPGATNASLVISNFQPAKIGLYSVLASNIAGYARSSTASLTTVPVDIINQPVSQTVRVTTNASFTVTASGTTPYFYQWRFQGTNIAGATNSSLTILNSQLANQGSYTVIVSNAVSSIVSAPAGLTVLPILPPKLSQFKVLDDGSTQMFISCEPESTLYIQFSTDLVVWQDLFNFLTHSGQVQFKDTQAPLYPQQLFYRIIMTH